MVYFKGLCFKLLFYVRVLIKNLFGLRIQIFHHIFVILIPNCNSIRQIFRIFQRLIIFHFLHLSHQINFLPISYLLIRIVKPRCYQFHFISDNFGISLHKVDKILIFGAMFIKKLKLHLSCNL